MTAATEITSVPEFYAHALASEREAAARYRQLADQMWMRHNNYVAYVFSRLAREESKHLKELERESSHLELPQPISSEYRWQGVESSDLALSDSVIDLMMSRHALEIALANEQRAQAFFETLATSASDPELRGLATKQAVEEAEHVAWVKRVLLDETQLFRDRG